jgi:hypothetical protein
MSDITIGSNMKIVKTVDAFKNINESAILPKPPS